MKRHWSFVAAALMLSAVGLSAGEQIQWHGYDRAIELKNDSIRVVLCPQVGGRVLEYSINGKNALYVSEQEREWTPGKRAPSSAGRFDIGPELVIPRRNSLWNGEWTAEITGARSAVLTSPADSATGVQLTRHFVLDDESSRLVCRQTIRNTSGKVQEWCHWSRTFAVGKGVCVIPLTDEKAGPMSRFPHKYIMYEEGSLINFRPEDPAIRMADNALHIYPTPRKPKLGFDSYAGVIAYYSPNDLLFVKRFRTFPNRVYNEAAGLTISVWYPDREMVELEPIGPRQRLESGEAAAFTEEWWLTEEEFPGLEGTVDMKRLSKSLQSLK